MNQFRKFGLPAGPRTGNAVRRALLESNKALREGRQNPLRDLGFGKVALRIPELDYYVLLERFPDLRSPDAETRKRAWQHLAKSDIGQAYRVD